MKKASLSPLPVLLCLLLLWGCFDTSRVAGGGGIIGNPPIGGILQDKGGKTVAYARVALYRQDYRPESGDTVTARTESDAAGRYLLKDVPADTYNIVATASEGNTLGMVSGIVVPPPAKGMDTVRARSCVLAEPASISVSLNLLSAVEGAFLYLPGTPVAEVVDSAALRRGALTLLSVPAGIFPALHYAKTKTATAANILGQPLVVEAGGTSVVGPYRSWKYARKVFINTTAAGAGTDEAVLGFPLLVRLDAANFDFTAARDSGQDLRFTKSDGLIPLPYQIERWDRAGERAEVWVRLDTVLADNGLQFIYLFAGKDSLASQSRGEAVFDTADGIAAVWHLGESAGVTPPVYRDAAGYGNHGTGVDLRPESQVEGVVGRALALDGLTQYLLVPRPVNLDFRTLTFSAWVKAECARCRIIDKTTAGDNDGYLFDIYGGRNRIGGFPYYYFGLTTIPAGQFAHVAVTFDGRTTRFYLNGEPDGATDSLTSVPRNDYDLRIGSSGTGVEKFQGILDEVRMSRMGLSGDWIRLSYRNQKPGSRVVSVR